MKLFWILIPLFFIGFFDIFSVNAESENNDLSHSLDYFKENDWNIYTALSEYGEFYFPYKIDTLDTSKDLNLDLLKINLDVLDRVISFEISDNPKSQLVIILSKEWSHIEYPSHYLKYTEPRENILTFILDEDGVSSNPITHEVLSSKPYQEISVDIPENLSKQTVKLSSWGVLYSHFSNLPKHDSEFFQLYSPLKQFQNSVKPSDIVCRDSFELLLRENNFPICIKSETKQKLLELGWKTNNEIIDFEPIIIKTGNSVGRCPGYCNHWADITPEKITFSKRAPMTGEEPIDIEKPISLEQWEKLTNLIDFEKFNAFPPNIGCPQCADGSITWIEISDGKTTKRIELGSPGIFPEFDSLDNELKNLINLIDE